MSIEYILYCMPITNQIIIPEVSNREPLPQNLTPAAEDLADSPPRPKRPSPLLLWKKTSSAFKKFRERKDTKSQCLAPEVENSENLPPLPPSRLYHLANKTAKSTLCFKQSQDGVLNLMTDVYFNPNEAPLYKDPLGKESSEDMGQWYEEMAHKKWVKSSISLDSHAQSRLGRIESLLGKMQEEGVMESVPVLRDDDPFIIVRKGSRQKCIQFSMKASKVIKTKVIKKQQKTKRKERSVSNKQPQLSGADRSKEQSLSGSQRNRKGEKEVQGGSGVLGKDRGSAEESAGEEESVSMESEWSGRKAGIECE